MNRHGRILAAVLLIAGMTSVATAGAAVADEYVPNSTFTKLEQDPPVGGYATTRILQWNDKGDKPQVWHEDMCEHARDYRCADLEGHKQISRRFETARFHFYRLCVDVNSNPTVHGAQRLKIDAEPASQKARTVDTGEESIQEGSGWERACHEFRAESEQTRIIFTGLPGPTGNQAGAVFTNITLR